VVNFSVAISFQILHGAHMHFLYTMNNKHLSTLKGADSHFWETLLKVYQAEHHNALLANRH